LLRREGVTHNATQHHTSRRQHDDRTSVLRSERSTSKDDVDRRVREGERRVAHLTEALAKVGWSDALASKLRKDECQLGKLEGRALLVGEGRRLVRGSAPDSDRRHRLSVRASWLVGHW
jgi:hypothetical protein